MGQLSEEGIAKKIAEQISVIAFKVPRLLRMEKRIHTAPGSRPPGISAGVSEQGALPEQIVKRGDRVTFPVKRKAHMQESR